MGCLGLDHLLILFQATLARSWISSSVWWTMKRLMAKPSPPYKISQPPCLQSAIIINRCVQAISWSIQSETAIDQLNQIVYRQFKSYKKRDHDLRMVQCTGRKKIEAIEKKAHGQNGKNLAMWFAIKIYMYTIFMTNQLLYDLQMGPRCYA